MQPQSKRGCILATSFFPKGAQLWVKQTTPVRMFCTGNDFDKFSKGQQTSRVHFEWQHFCGGSTNFPTANDACSFQLHGGHN